MSYPQSIALDLIFGRWRSQILYCAVKLGIFDAFTGEPKKTTDIASQLNLDPAHTYRLLRALGTLNLLQEDEYQIFAITELGSLFQKDHPQSMRCMTLLEEGPEHYALWKHLPDMIRDGKQNAFIREFGEMAFEHMTNNPNYAEVFNDAMSSYSSAQTALALEALDTLDFSSVKTICDIGGGYGHMLCSFLKKYPHLNGIVLEQANVIENKDSFWADKLGVEERCAYVSGDMFVEIPPANVYMMKMIIHDWNDEECVHILQNILRSVPTGGRVFIIEHVIPNAEIPHFAKLFDIHMMCWGTGRERTVEEYAALLKNAGWKYEQTWYPQSKMIGAVAGIKM